MLDRNQIIKQIEANVVYYAQFDDLHAAASVEALKELLMQIEDYDDVFDPVNAKQKDFDNWDKK